MIVAAVIPHAVPENGFENVYAAQNGLHQIIVTEPRTCGFGNTAHPWQGVAADGTKRCQAKSGAVVGLVAWNCFHSQYCACARTTHIQCFRMNQYMMKIRLRGIAHAHTMHIPENTRTTGACKFSLRSKTRSAEDRPGKWCPRPAKAWDHHLDHPDHPHQGPVHPRGRCLRITHRSFSVAFRAPESFRAPDDRAKLHALLLIFTRLLLILHGPKKKPGIFA